MHHSEAEVLFLVLLFAVAISMVSSQSSSRKLTPPIVINTWNFTAANGRAWKELSQHNSALDAIEFGCKQCEIDRCDGTVGWGGSPAETGETTLDAMIMDGETYDVGAVGGLRRIKGAISVARLVLEHTKHTLLVGDMATKFATDLGFKEESLASDESRRLQKEWLARSCQPNYWRNVEPDPSKFCGPYHLIDPPLEAASRKPPPEGGNSRSNSTYRAPTKFVKGHDTIGMIAMDFRLRLAAGTSTNGLRHKILGRVGDSPVPGAGAYAAREAGAAAATGDGDVMMRFLLSYQAVENLRRGMTSQEAATDVIKRQVDRTGRPFPESAVVVLSRDGYFGAACSGMKQFPFVVSDANKQIQTHLVDCFV